MRNYTNIGTKFVKLRKKRIRNPTTLVKFAKFFETEEIAAKLCNNSEKNHSTAEKWSKILKITWNYSTKCKTMIKLWAKIAENFKNVEKPRNKVKLPENLQNCVKVKQHFAKLYKNESEIRKKIKAKFAELSKPEKQLKNYVKMKQNCIDRNNI